jgi:copper/silver efflux system protein
MMCWCFPIVMLIIFVLLFMVFRSGKEAAHVMLAVPFALSGGVILQKLLGYDFNGAVWVGYIALFGTAVQTGVVMVVYLEESVKAKMAELGRANSPARPRPGGQGRRQTPPAPESHDRGHHRRQPAAHHVEHRQGAEVMKPLATPVIGGMISSLIHILIVTPVIFLWLRERHANVTAHGV